MNHNQKIPVYLVRENFKALEPTFKRRESITVDGEKWRIHRVGLRTKVNRRSETLSYFRFQPLDCHIGNASFFSLNNKTGSINRVRSSYKGLVDEGWFFMLTDCTGFFGVLVKSELDQIVAVNIETVLGTSLNFNFVVESIIETYGKSPEVMSLINRSKDINDTYLSVVEQQGLKC